MFNKIHGRLFWLAASVAFINACDGGKANSPTTSPFFLPSTPEAEWRMVMEEDFSGSALDATMWEAQAGDGSDVGLTRWGNNEQQWYLAANATVANGMLTITAKEEVAPNIPATSSGSFPYTSARIRTAEKFDIQYGRIEARAKVPEGQGFWPAIWMLPTDSPYGTTWAGNGEIDILEVVNAGTDKENVLQTLHYGYAWPLNQRLGVSNLQDNMALNIDLTEFNDYALEWDPTEIRWYINGVQSYVVERGCLLQLLLSKGLGGDAMRNGWHGSLCRRGGRWLQACRESFRAFRYTLPYIGEPGGRGGPVAVGQC